jgi:phosphatidylinositol kinase/protein kinase (PI-3  family)
MTDTPGNSNGQQPSRLDRIEAILATLATQQVQIQQNQIQLQQIVQRNSEAIAELGQQLESSISGVIETIDYAVESTEQLVLKFLGQSSNGHDEQ